MRLLHTLFLQSTKNLIIKSMMYDSSIVKLLQSEFLTLVKIYLPTADRKEGHFISSIIQAQEQVLAVLVQVSTNSDTLQLVRDVKVQKMNK